MKKNQMNLNIKVARNGLQIPPGIVIQLSFKIPSEQRTKSFPYKKVGLRGGLPFRLWPPKKSLLRNE